MCRLSEHSSYGSYGTNLICGTRQHPHAAHRARSCGAISEWLHGFLLNHCSHCLVILTGTKNPVQDRDDNRKRDQQQSVLSLPGYRFLLTLAP